MSEEVRGWLGAAWVIVRVAGYVLAFLWLRTALPWPDFVVLAVWAVAIWSFET